MTPTFNKQPDNTVNWLRETPIAHRGLHDRENGIIENTLSAARAAIEHGYPIEVDLQPSVDGIPVVFHDYDLKRLTGETGQTRKTTASGLGKIRISGSNDFIPTLQEFLDVVDGRVGVLIELKGQKDEDAGFVEAVAENLKGYPGDAAIMSFNHWLLEDARKFAPHLTLGLTAEGDDKLYEVHRAIAEKCQIDFLDYNHKHLDTKMVHEFRKTEKPVVCWTVRTPEEAVSSKKLADQITFENFLP